MGSAASSASLLPDDRRVCRDPRGDPQSDGETPSQPARTPSCGRVKEELTLAETRQGEQVEREADELLSFLRANADDRLPAGPLGWVECRGGVVEGRDAGDVRPQPPVPHPLDDLTQLGAVGLDDEVDGQAVSGYRREPYSRRNTGWSSAAGSLVK